MGAVRANDDREDEEVKASEECTATTEAKTIIGATVIMLLSRGGVG